MRLNTWHEACKSTGGPHKWTTISIEKMQGPNGTVFHRTLRQCGRLQYQDTTAEADL